MQIKYRSCKSLLSDLDDDFQIPTNDWFYKAINWIDRGLGIMSLHETRHPCTKNITIEGNKGLLPCSVNSIMFFSRCGYYYRIKSDFTLESQCGCPDELTYNQEETYSVIVNESYVQTKFETGDINVHFYGTPVDDEGYPMIIDDPEVTEALNWFIIYKLMTSGYKHPVIQDWRIAKQQWEIHYPRAQNKVDFPSIQRANELVNNFTTIAKENNLIQKFFTK